MEQACLGKHYFKAVICESQSLQIFTFKLEEMFELTGINITYNP